MFKNIINESMMKIFTERKYMSENRAIISYKNFCAIIKKKEAINAGRYRRSTCIELHLVV